LARIIAPLVFATCALAFTGCVGGMAPSATAQRQSGAAATNEAGTTPSAGASGAASVDCAQVPQPTSPHVTLAPSELTVGVVNESTLTVKLAVNGAVLRTLGPGEGGEVAASELPRLPWDASVESPTGRELVGLTIHAGDLWREPCANNTLAKRVDLSCGRIDIYAVVDMSGPPPGPGRPGDCAP